MIDWWDRPCEVENPVVRDELWARPRVRKYDDDCYIEDYQDAVVEIYTDNLTPGQESEIINDLERCTYNFRYCGEVKYDLFDDDIYIDKRTIKVVGYMTSSESWSVVEVAEKYGTEHAYFEQ